VKFKLNDPNLFHFYNLTGSITKDYRSIFELDQTLLPDLEENLGFTLKLKNSKIEHQDAGEGVFLSCKKRRFLLPGTLLGFYPGVFH